MANRQWAPAAVLARGIGICLGVYGGAVAALAWAAVRGAVGEESLRVWLAAACALAGSAGGLVCGRKLPWGAAGGCVSCAAGFAAVLLVGNLCLRWGLGPWSAVLLGCAMAGGCAAGAVCGRRRRRPVRRGGRR